jgi:hypothetical protein
LDKRKHTLSSKKNKENIIPLPLDNYYIKKDSFKEIKFKIGFADINPATRTRNNEPPKKFYYIPYSSEKLKLMRDDNFTIHNSDNVQIEFKNPNENEVILNFLFRNEAKNFSQEDQYSNNQWKLIE